MTEVIQILLVRFAISVFFSVTVTNASTAQVRFETSDLTLQQLHDVAVKKSLSNISVFGKYHVLVEGAGYPHVWLETQPMGGEMYAKRNIQIGLNNQLIFMAYQRTDGKLPGRIRNESGRILPDYGWIQGFCFPAPALNMYYWLNKDTCYLKKLYDCLAQFDGYLWRVRDSDSNGCLESWCVYDTGEDNCIRLDGSPLEWPFEYAPTDSLVRKSGIKIQQTNSQQGIPVPIESMDFMSYSFSARSVLSEISLLLNNGMARVWADRAISVKAKIKSYLWDPVKLACYDRDSQNKTMDVLLQNNIRCMYYGSFDQQMADNFIKKHLFNANEFWTFMPLPSIAVNDPAFKNVNDNNWSGQPQGLTFQRSITALENYGHYAEVGLIGKRLIDVLKRERKFTQQYDPFTGKADNSEDGYGPTMLSLLEYISRMYGIHYSKDKVWWSSLHAGNETSAYEQVIHGKTYTQKVSMGKLFASINGKLIFTCSTGVRVITDLKGRLLEVVGIDSVQRRISISSCNASGKLDLDLMPNAVYKLGIDNKAILTCFVPFK